MATVRGLPRGVFVLVVHDSAVDVAGIFEALDDTFVLREATTAFDALERLSGAPLACIVCVAGGAIRCEDFHNLVSRASPEQAQRIVFVADGDADAEFLRSTGSSWLPSSAEPSEVLAVVRAVGALR
jgi:hypothetical protein